MENMNIIELKKEYFAARQQLDSCYSYPNRKQLIAKCKELAEIIGTNAAYILNLKSIHVCKQRACYYTKYQR